MPVSANLDHKLDKAWENSKLEDVLTAPVSALAGVSNSDADLLSKAFNIKTIGDLGRNKHFRAAYALTLLSEGSGGSK